MRRSAAAGHGSSRERPSSNALQARRERPRRYRGTLVALGERIARPTGAIDAAHPPGGPTWGVAHESRSPHPSRGREPGLSSGGVGLVGAVMRGAVLGPPSARFPPGACHPVRVARQRGRRGAPQAVSRHPAPRCRSCSHKHLAASRRNSVMGTPVAVVLSERRSQPLFTVARPDVAGRRTAGHVAVAKIFRGVGVVIPCRCRLHAHRGPGRPEA